MGDTLSTQSEVDGNSARVQLRPWRDEASDSRQRSAGSNLLGGPPRRSPLTVQEMSDAFKQSFLRMASETRDDWHLRMASEPRSRNDWDEGFGDMGPTPYDAALQERVYLGMAPPLFHSDDELAEAENEHDASGSQNGVPRLALPCASGASSSTKVPGLKCAAKSRSLRLDAVPKAAQRRAEAWKDFQVPIRHTFVHFDNPEKLALFERLAGRASPGQATRKEEGQLLHSSSSPALLGSNDDTPLHGLEQDQLSTSSAPACVKTRSEKTRQQIQSEARHERGECRPCAYYLYKKDGCRLGTACEFCHLCPRGEANRRNKKAKAKPKNRPRQRPGLGRNRVTSGNASD